MVNKEDANRAEADIAEAQAENQALREELAAAQIKNQTLWIVLAEIARRLQGHSTSIKAAVSSLLDYDIFWDESTQHEFLETIDSSVDGISGLTAVLTLAFKVEARNLEMRREAHLLQEILTTTVSSLAEADPEARLNLIIPPTGRSVRVDYEYLVLALTLLFQVLFSVGDIPADGIDLTAEEAEHVWHLQISRPDEETLQLICDAFHYRSDRLLSHEKLLPEDSLRLLTACKLFQLQQIDVATQPGPEGNPVLRLAIPAA